MSRSFLVPRARLKSPHPQDKITVALSSPQRARVTYAETVAGGYPLTFWPIEQGSRPGLRLLVRWQPAGGPSPPRAGPPVTGPGIISDS
jgi:hypothetical protein